MAMVMINSRRHGNGDEDKKAEASVWKIWSVAVVQLNKSFCKSGARDDCQVQQESTSELTGLMSQEPSST